MNDNRFSHSSDKLTPEERQRYSRHLALPQISEHGQLALKKARVLIVGAGGLGSPAAIYLAAAGIGHIGIVDDDCVDVTNLQRQILHATPDVGNPKVNSARKHLTNLNPLINIQIYKNRLTELNAESIISTYDVVVDGSDNFPTRYLINDACHFLDKRWVYGSIYRFEGQVSVFGGREHPCYRCLYPSPPPPEAAPDCSQAGVLGVLPGVIGTIQATEVIKRVTGIGDTLSGRILYYDALSMNFRIFTLGRDAECPLCGKKPLITNLRLEKMECSSAVETSNVSDDEIDPIQLKSLLESNNPPLLIDIREEWEHALCDIGKSLLIPIDELESRLDEIPDNQQVVLFCRSGVRTRKVLDHLKRSSSCIYHLKGGIIAWADKVDHTIHKY